MEARIQPSRRAREEAKARIQSDESETVKKRGKKAEEIVSKPTKNGKAKSEDPPSTKEVAKKKTIAVRVKKPLISKTDDDIVSAKGKGKAKPGRRSRSAEPSSVFVVKAASKKASHKDGIQEEAEAKPVRSKKPASNSRAKKVIAPPKKAISDSADSGEETVDEEPKKPASSGRAKKNQAHLKTSQLDEDSEDESAEEEIKKPTKATAPSKKEFDNSTDSGEESDDGDHEKATANARSMKKPPPAKKVVAATKQPRGKKAAALVKAVAVPNLSEESDTAEDATDEETVHPGPNGATSKNSSSIAEDENNSDNSGTDKTDEDALKPASTSRAAKKKISPVGSSKDDAPAKKKARSVKAVTKQSSTESEGKEAAEPSTSKGAKKLLNNVNTVYSKIDFGIKEKFNFKITSWNVAGLRALFKKNSDYFTHENADVICLTEVKCGSEAEVPKEAQLEGYHAYWNVGKGGPGVGLLSKVKPLNISYDLPDSDFSDENRVITAEFEKFFLLSVYTVNSSRGLKNLEKRMEWNETFDAHVHGLDKKKPVIIAGDLNVSHQEIDLANPKANKKSAGFTQEERDGFTKLLAMGFVDTFRHFNPDTAGAYTYWTYLNNARNKNVGWRLDYFVASKRFMKSVKSNVIRSTVLGSDHCPIVLFLNL